MTVSSCFIRLIRFLPLRYDQIKRDKDNFPKRIQSQFLVELEDGLVVLEVVEVDGAVEQAHRHHVQGGGLLKTTHAGPPT